MRALTRIAAAAALAVASSSAATTPHLIPIADSPLTLVIDVASPTSFRLGVRNGATYAPSAIEQETVRRHLPPAPSQQVTYGAQSGLLTTFGALVAGPDGSWTLYDAANATLLSSSLPPYMTNGSATRDAGIALPVTSLAAVDGPGAACLGNGMFGPPFYYNRAALYFALAVSGWFYDPVAPHCYPASFDGRLGDVTPPPRDPMCPGNGTQPGTDASGSTRSPTFPGGLSGTTEASCCEACAGDANCVAWVWSDGSDPDPTGNCWPLASFDGTNQHKGRVFSPIPPTPAAQAWWAMGLAADFYLAPAADALAYNTAYYQLTGSPEIPPLYAFGLTATYWGYDTMLEVEGNMTAFRDGRFPVSTFVLDYDWFLNNDPDVDFGYDKIMFGPHNFTHPPGSSVPNASTTGPSDLFAHFQNDINMHWGGIRKPRSYSNIPFANASGWLLPNNFSVGAGDNNYNMTAPGWAQWYASNHLHFLQDGVSMWWNDEGETQYYTYSWWNNVQRNVSETVSPGKRFWSINRSFQPGMQSNAATTWTGDRQDCSHTTFLSFATAGQQYIACDMTAPSANVLVRQYQDNAFSSIMRVHAMHGTPRFPYLWGGEAQQEAFRAALNTRYHFIPHIYSLAHRLRATFHPIIQPASWLFSSNAASFPLAVADATYMMGDTILPADVSTSNSPDPNENVTHVNIPPGLWYAFNDTLALEGPILDLTYEDVPLDKIVVFIAAGAILTLNRDVVQHTGELGGALEVHVYAGADGAFTLVEDDGATTQYIDSPATATRSTAFAWDDAAKTLSWTVSGTFSGPNSYVTLDPVLLFVANATAPVAKGPVVIGASGTVQF
jgi:alpha-glucosidase